MDENIIMLINTRAVVFEVLSRLADYSLEIDGLGQTKQPFCWFWK